jgi:S-DNA-T family DNA segregation ATPase FtsK/SpoIIIE
VIQTKKNLENLVEIIVHTKYIQKKLYLCKSFFKKNLCNEMANKPRENTVIRKESGKAKLGKRKKTAGEKKSSKSAKSKNGGFGKLGDFLTNERVHAITGVFLLLFTIFLLFSFISFLFTHEADDSIFKLNFFETLNTEDKSQNKMGIFGLYFSFLFIKHWFGIASFGFLLLGLIYGVRLLVKKSLLPILRTTIIMFATMIWLSMTLSFIFTAPEQIWLGGGLGDQFQEYFIGKMGNPGFILLMIFLVFVILIAFGGTAFFKKWSKTTKSAFEQEDDNQEDTFDDDDDDETPKEKKPSIFARLFASKKEKQISDLDDFDDEFPVVEKTPFSTKPTETLPSEDVIAAQIIPGEDIFIDDENEIEPFTVIYNEPQEENAENEDNTESEDSIEDDIFQDEEEGTEYMNLEPYNPREDLSHFQFPETDLLENYTNVTRTREEKEFETAKNKLRIKETLEHYGVTIQSISAIEGPTVTLYEIVPSHGIRIARIKNLEDDIALSLAALGIRIIAPIPGRGTVGIEVPNAVPQVVSMKSVIMSEKFQNTGNMALPIAMGKTISNEVYVFDLTKMPHVLMAGATGQGKSVGLNAILTSLLYKKHPAELKFILVDPKQVELTLYSKIERHYLAKLPDAEEAIITDTKKVVRTLSSLCKEMDTRYGLLKMAQCRTIIEYNEKFKARKLNPNKGHRFLPYIVLIFDEFADCIMTAGREVETPIARLAQLARAVGIHLVIATQRPSVNVITGLIKANFPARIAFRVSSKIDSRTILDSGGAENLIGKGDMLIYTGSSTIRVQCAFVDTPEVERVCDYIGEQHGYTRALMLPEVEEEGAELLQESDDGEFDSFFADAAREIVSKQQGSTSFLQRKFKLGYNRAGRIMDQLEREKIVGPSVGSKTREVLIKDMNTLEEFLRNNGL